MPLLSVTGLRLFIHHAIEIRVGAVSNFLGGRFSAMWNISHFHVPAFRVHNFNLTPGTFFQGFTLKEGRGKSGAGVVHGFS